MGMRFDPLEGEKEHYKVYVLQLGFSIKMNTSRKTVDTHVLVKQKFVSNKFQKPIENYGGASSNK